MGKGLDQAKKRKLKIVNKYTKCPINNKKFLDYFFPKEMQINYNNEMF